MPNHAAKPLFKLSLVLGLSALLLACNEEAQSQSSAMPATPTPASEPSKSLMLLPTVMTQSEADAAYFYGYMHIENEVKRRYGSQSFLQFVEGVNGKKLASFKQHAKVYFPTLLKAFQQAKLDPQYLPAIQALSEAHTQFYQQFPAYLQARPQGNQATRMPLAPAVQQGFQTSQYLIQQAITQLKQPKAKHRVPKKAIQQLEALHSELGSLNAGQVDGYGYDYDMVQQHFGYAFSYLLQWTKQGYR